MVTETMVPEQITREVTIAAPVARVWSALTEAEHLGSWFADAGAEVDLRAGGTATLRWQEHGAVQLAIQEVAPQRFFSYRWLHAADQEPRPDNSTLVEFTLTPQGEATRLRVVESGFRNLSIPAEQQRRRVEENTQGWQEELEELRLYAQQLAA